MTKILLAAAFALVTGLLCDGGFAMPLSNPTARVQDTALFCGPDGCGPIWGGPRYSVSNWGEWGHVYRPACPIDYYYACRRGPLGYGACACWPYRHW
jgi:hypothetical protein